MDTPERWREREREKKERETCPTLGDPMWHCNIFFISGKGFIVDKFVFRFYLKTQL